MLQKLILLQLFPNYKLPNTLLPKLNLVSDEQEKPILRKSFSSEKKKEQPFDQKVLLFSMVPTVYSLGIQI